MAAEVNDQNEANEPSERRGFDRELLILNRIARHLEEFSPVEQRRAICWLSDRYGPKPEHEDRMGTMVSMAQWHAGHKD